ncbi:SAM-dependent methyltransferase [Terrarubrum flagellatum]|uniref:protein-L-isoaspartate O-methyltransferase family protein n=1 Tax=Terrirubrum flagellatum TaxID=2895980 RepID=UPI003144F7D4
MTDRRLDSARAIYASLVAGQSGASPELRERIERAFALVPREHFMGRPPWMIHTGGPFGAAQTDDPIHLYQNVLVSLDRARGVNNGEPFLHGQMIAALAPQSGDRALHIGCGTGYYTAILATLIAPGGRVSGYEILEDLAGRAKQALKPWENADVMIASGSGAAESSQIENGSAIRIPSSAAIASLPPADLIYVSAGASRPAAAWLDALKEGGRLVFPLAGDGGAGVALKITRTAQGFSAHIVSRAIFIPCAGAVDAEEAKSVGEGLRKLGRRESLFLHRDNHIDDDTVIVGKGWRLSRR